MKRWAIVMLLLALLYGVVLRVRGGGRIPTIVSSMNGTEQISIPHPGTVLVSEQAPVPVAADLVTGKTYDVVPVLMFHYIRTYTDLHDPIGVNLSVSPEHFRTMLGWLSAHHYATVPLSYLSSPTALMNKPISITFDDGYQDAYTDAYPSLKEKGFSALFYIIVNKVGTPGYLTWDEIKEMQAGGMRFGSHTLNHVNLVSAMPVSLMKELVDSKKILAVHVGQEVDDFCYPSGKYNDAVKSAVKLSGYMTATTTHGGVAKGGGDPLALPRLRITDRSNLATLLRE